jgi:hypothetical protein
LKVNVGHSVVFRPCLSMYQLAHPPETQTVPGIWRWMPSM